MRTLTTLCLAWGLGLIVIGAFLRALGRSGIGPGRDASDHVRSHSEKLKLIWRRDGRVLLVAGLALVACGLTLFLT